MALFGTVKRRFRCPIVVTAFDAENFLGLPAVEGNPDVIVLPIPYELTTSYGQGTENGPSATLKASTQVELYDPLLPEDLPCGFGIKTANPWNGEGNSLQEQLDGIEKYLHSNVSNFPARAFGARVHLSSAPGAARKTRVREPVRLEACLLESAHAVFITSFLSKTVEAFFARAPGT